MERNIYKIEKELFVTSDEEITRNDYWLNRDDNSINKNEFTGGPNDAPSCKKIILTTDQDLIKDGVQLIDDEFLEWFVKNPSCEFVEIVKVPYHDESGYSYLLGIPKEEPKPILGVDFEFSIDDDGMCIEIPIIKQETLEEAKKYAELSYYGDEVDAFVTGAKWQSDRMYSQEEVKDLFNQYKEEFSIYRNMQILNAQFEEWFNQNKKKSNMKSKETLEEAANKIYPNNGFEDELYWDLGEIYRDKFIEGAKWQAERMYSEEEVLELLLSRPGPYLTDKEINDWFEQFKKK